MSLVEQEHRSRAVDVECGGADRADVLPLLEAGVVRAIAPWRRCDPITLDGRAESVGAQVHVYRVPQRQRAIRRLGASRRRRE
jgi:hypothetical protein